MKTLMAFSLLVTTYYYPETMICLLIITLFILDVIDKCICQHNIGKESYSMIKEILNDDSSENYLIHPIKCQKIDFEHWSYRDIQYICRTHGITGLNRPKKVLITALNSL